MIKVVPCEEISAASVQTSPMTKPLAPDKPFLRAAAFALGAVVFGAAYSQAPLYYSNQNQYFLHGLADAGAGVLRHDWLANTKDPTPAFSLLVAATQRYLYPAAFYGYYVLLFVVYLASMVSLFSALAGGRDTPRLRFAFVALLLTVHSALARWLSYRFFGLDYPWYFQAGVAGQYVLGAVFQPSTFGVLLVLSVALFVRGRPFAAVASACLGATLHSTYMLGAGMLTVAYLCVLFREKQYRRAGGLGAWALVLVAPVLAYVLIVFGPTSAAAFAEAQDVLVHVRIPHHCLPRLWCDGIAVGQIAWVLFGLALARGTRLFSVLAVPFLMALVLTLVQLTTDSNALALMFPWRISSVLVPVATTVVLSRLVLAGAAWLDQPRVAVGSAAVIAALAAAGLGITFGRLGFQSSKEEGPVMEFVKANKTAGDVYLIPVQVPELAKTTHGSLSSDFKPVADKKRDRRLIPVDFQRFRLYTGAAVFVDFKSIPYKDVEVLAWRDRLRQNQQLFAQVRGGKGEEACAELRRHGITHVVTTATQPPADGALEQVYADPFYRVYRVPDASAAGQ
jgi:hypothetical protein